MPIIQVENVTKEYNLGALHGLKQTLLDTGARLVGKKTPQRPLFKALDDVSFSIEPGEVVGIIGHNGAGKSTLLKMLAKISTPTRGSVKVSGRIAPLIEVGAGFVPDFTGRENVYLNGAILGMPRREIDKKFEEIVDFAEMEEFIDTPVKRYISGMQVKLAFAVATSIESEILIIDEVLAVGDLAFQRKCFDRMEDIIKRQGRTVLLVSHNIRQVVRICGRTILMNHGKIIADGPSAETCDKFYTQSNETILRQAQASHKSRGEVLTSGEVELVSLSLINNHGSVVDTVTSGDDCTIRCTFDVKKPLKNVDVVYGFHTTDFVYISAMGTSDIAGESSLQQGRVTVDCSIKNLPLAPGVYAIRVGVFDNLLTKIFYGENLKVFSVSQRDGSHGKVILHSLINIPSAWNFSPEEG
ncbi:MAG: polysaccharide/polyol phosphate ABC transporter ATP-binding protein [Hydrogenophilales bacterium 28-61-23]|nr:MAG: polysaccharide/polyol phosphate ABC transporter ATP-binding protein [Hydrogenophilales bacterium 28-61-23]